jgi:ATP-dependent helicase HrpB
LRAAQLGCLSLGADLAALLSERDVLRRPSKVPGGTSDPDIAERLDILTVWRREKKAPSSADPWALRTLDRTSAQLLRLMSGAPGGSSTDPELISRLLLCGFPDRVAKRREEGTGRFVLSQGRGILLSPSSPLSSSPFIIAVSVDAGERTEGRAHIASPVTEELLRQECSSLIETARRVEWERKGGRIVATIEEKLGTLVLSTRPFTPSEEETAPLICRVIRSAPDRTLTFSSAARQFQGRVALLRRLFPEEPWPDLSDSRLTAAPEEWLSQWLGGVRTLQDLSALDVLPALRARLSREQLRLLDEQAPVSVVVPSGHRIPLDYSVGGVPVLAVKLQEMFGLADTPTIARGRIKVLLHLLSPARRPVQITQDLKGFWNRGYQEVKKELKGRYPKHPWPDDPWNAVPTRRTKPKGR